MPGVVTHSTRTHRDDPMTFGAQTGTRVLPITNESRWVASVLRCLSTSEKSQELGLTTTTPPIMADTALRVSKHLSGEPNFATEAGWYGELFEICW